MPSEFADVTFSSILNGNTVTAVAGPPINKTYTAQALNDAATIEIPEADFLGTSAELTVTAEGVTGQITITMTRSTDSTVTSVTMTGGWEGEWPESQGTVASVVMSGQWQGTWL